MSQSWATGLVGTVVFVLCYALRKQIPVTARLWARIPDGWRWLVPFAVSGLTAFAEGLVSGRGWAAAAQVGVTAFCVAITGHKLGTDSPLPYGSKPVEAPAVVEEKDEVTKP